MFSHVNFINEFRLESLTERWTVCRPIDTDSVHFRNIQKDAGCSSNSRNPHWVVLVPLGKIP